MMTSSADVAARAGVSRSTVSQILNGHGHRFKPDMVDRVQAVAQELGYRPSLAGRALVRGKSDVVITLLPDISFGPRLRELIDRVTDGLAESGTTNLIRFTAGGQVIDDAVLALRPVGLWSVAPLLPEQHEQLESLGARVVDQPRELQIAIDESIGALQARHLIDRGYPAIVVAMPEDQREQPFATAREQGALAEAAAVGIATLPTVRLGLARNSSGELARRLPPGDVGVVAYNDDAALAVMAAARHAGRAVPEEIGVIGVDNTVVAGVSEPSITTIDIDVRFSAHEIVRALQGEGPLPTNALETVRSSISVIPGGSTARDH